MTTSTLRNWGGAIAVSLPKKVLATLGLQAGSPVAVRIRDGSIVLSPAPARFALAQLEKEQRELERSRRRRLMDKRWLNAPARGREQL